METLKTNNPQTIDGKTYDKLAMSLAISTILTDKVSVNMALRLTPYSEEFEKLGDVDSVICSQDAGNTVDIDIRTCVSEIEAAIQKLINAKGL